MQNIKIQNYSILSYGAMHSDL